MAVMEKIPGDKKTNEFNALVGRPTVRHKERMPIAEDVLQELSPLVARVSLFPNTIRSG